MLMIKNPSGWEFRWPERSNFIEIYHDNASYPDQPVDVISAGTMKRSESTLKQLANESAEYGRPYA